MKLCKKLLVACTCLLLAGTGCAPDKPHYYVPTPQPRLTTDAFTPTANEFGSTGVGGPVELPTDTNRVQQDEPDRGQVVETITPVATSQPAFSNLRLCEQDCLNGSRSVEAIRGYIEELWLAFDYSGMSPNVRYTRSWFNEGRLWIRYNCLWQGPRSGTFSVRLYDYDGGLHYGEWQVILAIEGVGEYSAIVELFNNNMFWDPVGLADTCPDWP